MDNQQLHLSNQNKVRTFMKNLSFIGASQYTISTDGALFSLRTMSLMRGWVNDYRYYSITFDDGSHSVMAAHQLVALSYIPNDDPEKIYVNHLDGNKLNNKVENLEWCTPSENNLHAHKIGLTCGKKPHSPDIIPLTSSYYNEYGNGEKLSEDQVRQICSLIEQGYRDVDVSRMLPWAPRRLVNSLRHKQKDKYYDITSEYNFNFKKGERLSPESVVELCELLQSGMKVMDISRQTGVNRKKIERLKARISFTEISKSYNW